MSTDAPTSSDVRPIVSDDAVPKSVPAQVGEAGFAAGSAEVPESISSADTAEAEGGKLKPKQKGARKPKPCVRCDERRKREREYARASRVRAKLTKDGAAPADAAMEVGGEAAAPAGGQ
jgi:hypothetical protein